MIIAKRIVNVIAMKASAVSFANAEVTISNDQSEINQTLQAQSSLYTRCSYALQKLKTTEEVNISVAYPQHRKMHPILSSHKSSISVNNNI